MWIALTRELSPRLADCELSFVDREPIDLDLARLQHRAYQTKLSELGCEVRELPATPELPDSVFVEDTAVVLDEIALITRPGADSRRAEIETMADVLAEYRPIRRIVEPGTLDGGDVLRIGKRLFVGLSARSNSAAIEQMQTALAPFGYRVEGVPMRDCLHLKSAVTAVSDEAVLINPDWVDSDAFADFQQLRVDPAEPHAANVVRLEHGLIMPAGFPHTRDQLRNAGLVVHEVALSELQKAEGAVTCCSVLLRNI
ncbi:dimethylarginine dimethylaminohydrolase family protein [Pseudomarimonas arenosa]|uniref:Dimethylargininase n=1 Tax=Pseudomarimonas arenosa TaxID=2774145 RepID=A0AAW3ZM00_9GAMM|nr:arginine deiminase family protein [Pseudomarimonas arenosa]MBD8527178.1 dimethylargininase [Pseudomarimonas arenosa]